MKILHVVKKYPPAVGGDAVVVSSLRQQQQAAGHEVAVVTSNCDEIAKGAGVYKFGLRDSPASLDEITLKRMASLLVLFFRMFAILHRERPDVIHTHSIDMAFFVSGAARFYGIPMVHTFHIVTFYDPEQTALRRKSELWLARRAGLCKATAPNSFDVKKLQLAGLKQAVVLPNGVYPAFWETGTHTGGGEEFVFLTVGRLECQKGHEYLIRAASLLTRALPRKFRVVIVGDGSQKSMLGELIRTLRLDEVVALVGRKNPEEVRLLLSGADAAVFPSLYETTPVTMLEAWAARVPVIATPVGILRDVPAGFGAAYLVPPKDEHSLMQTMKRCATDARSRAAVAIRGHTEAQKYTWPTIAQAAESIYRSAR